MIRTEIVKCDGVKMFAVNCNDKKIAMMKTYDIT